MHLLFSAIRTSGAVYSVAMLLVSGHPADGADALTTAWRDGRFNVDVPGVVSESNIVLGQPNLQNTQAMPIGNGTLGGAVWSANGLTVQLNRADTLPGRVSPGQVIIPGLAQMTAANDYRGVLDLYNGEFVESGGGMTATTYIDADEDVLVIDVTGAAPGSTQTATLTLWNAPNPWVTRAPSAVTWAASGALLDSWVDTQPGGTGETFRSFAAIGVDATNASATKSSTPSVTLSFTVKADGSFRVLVAAPKWDGQDPHLFASQILAQERARTASQQTAWWHAFWSHIGLIKLDSANAVAQYMENLRTIYLYMEAASNRGQFPGSQAGVADLFSAFQDSHQWDPAAYWHWNLRMMVAANLGAGAFDLNQPYFNLYNQNRAALEAWTSVHMDGRPGIGVPETMRFNGVGIEYEYWTNPNVHFDLDANVPPYYNARTLSTGSEIGLWMWRQYLATDDRNFLEENYAFMRDCAEFILAYAQPGPDHMLHTSPSNAHETQWDVTDPTTDISAMRSYFPAVIEAANLLGRDATLVKTLEAATPLIVDYPRTDVATQTQLLTAAADSSGADMIAPSYLPAAPKYNSENIGLEPVWPYDLIGDTSSLFDLEQRTYASRPNKNVADWCYDSIQAARLDLASQVESSLTNLVEAYQQYPNGFAAFATGGEFYCEMLGVVSAALQEAIVQDYDGLLRIAPAWPADWSANATVYVRHNTRVDVQVSQGTLVTIGIETGYDGLMQLRNPWPGDPVEVVSRDGTVVTTSADAVLVFKVESNNSYLVQQPSSPNSQLPFAPVSGSPATQYKTLGSSNMIGLPTPQ
jgi:alpha-L-fucosidase 2